MSKMYLFESGSTKTTVLIANINGSENTLVYESLSLPGYNPNRPNISFLDDLSELPITAKDRVEFYGSGLASKEYQSELAGRFKALFNCEINVNGDLIGAARATLADSRGIVAILGTGGVVGYYNGSEILDQYGGYGYLIDDIGGGYELGKRIVSAWLNGELGEELDAKIESHFNSDKENFIRNYYSELNSSNQKKGLDTIAQVTTIIPPYIEHVTLQELLIDYFEIFFKRHVNPIINKTGISHISFVGSIALIFQKTIQKVANKYGIDIDTVIQYPAEKLLEYHLKKQN